VRREDERASARTRKKTTSHRKERKAGGDVKERVSAALVGTPPRREGRSQS